MKGTSKNETLYWNSRARSYPLPFEKKTAAKTDRILRLLKSLGLAFKGEDVLDIGCGTGVYGLRLAAEARNVLGIDSSAAMLKVLRAVRRERGITNARCLLAKWCKVPVSRVAGRFGVALASMTAAIKTRADILKMENAAPCCVYIGWAGVRRNALLEKVYTAHGVEYRAPEGEARTLKILRDLGRRGVTVRYIRDSWVKEASVEDTLAELAVSMRVNGARFDEGLCRTLLRRYTRAGKVRQLTRARKAVIIWRRPG